MKTKYKIFIAKILSKMLIFFIGKKELIVERNEIKWSLELDQGIDLSIFLFGNFEKSILDNAKKLMQNDHLDIIDIGANLGVHSLNFAKTFKNSKIYSIEPTDYAFEKFEKNLQLNPNIDNVNLNRLFLSQSSFLPSKIYSSWNVLSKEEKHEKHLGIMKSTSESKVSTLDDFIENKNINRKTLIKCDVDGNELSVFKSGHKYLKNFKPYIIMELAPYLYEENGYNYNDLLNFLKKFDYNFYSASSYKEINDIFDYAKSIKDGSSVNIFLK